MSAESRFGHAILVPTEKIIEADGSVTCVGEMHATDQETAEIVAQELAKQTGRPVKLIDSSNPSSRKTFGMSSAFGHGTCEWEPTGPKPRIGPPKDPRLN